MRQEQLTTFKVKCVMRRGVVGFDAKIHKKVKEFHEKHAAVALGKCEVKEGRGGCGVEVFIRNSSGLQHSPSKTSML